MMPVSQERLKSLPCEKRWVGHGGVWKNGWVSFLFGKYQGEHKLFLEGFLG